MRFITSCIVLLTAILISCSSDSYNSSDFVAGEGFTNSNLKVITFDTLTLKTSTVKLDSFVTGDASRILVGSYTDPIFGTVTASSYFELEPESYILDHDAVYDSITISLKLDGYFYNDTTLTQKIEIRELLESVVPTEDYFYNTSSIAYSSNQILGTLSFTPRPLQKDSISTRLNDSLGLNLFERIKEKSITDQAGFRDYFKGMVLLAPEQDNSCILGYAKDAGALTVQLHYTQEDEDNTVTYTLDFNLSAYGSTTPFFNAITSTYNLESLTAITSQEQEVVDSITENKTFVHSGLGLATKFSLPTIKSLDDIEGSGSLLSANLKFYPSAQDHTNNLPLNDSLSVYLVDRKNVILNQLTSASSSAIYAVLNKVDSEFNNTYYEADISTFADLLYTTTNYTDYGLLFLPPNNNSTVDRNILTGSNALVNPAKITINYTIYQND